MAQTDTQTDRHGDSMTESAQWGRFSKNFNAAATSNVPDINSEQCLLFQSRESDMLDQFMQGPVINFPNNSACKNAYRNKITINIAFSRLP